MTDRNLSDRDKELYRILRRVAMAGAPTPRHRDLAAELTAAGHPTDTCELGARLDKLIKANFLERGGGGHGNRIVYRIVGTRHWTTARGPEWTAGDWPRPTITAAASYDAAVARREFARHESGERPEPFRRVRAAYGAHSLTGCSAAMAVA